MDPLTGMTRTEAIFGTLDSMVDEASISRDESRATVSELVNVLKSKNITYGCAEKLLDATRTALREMSQSIQL